MSSVPSLLTLLLLVFLAPIGISYAADDSVVVKEWLHKMIKAEHLVSYRGTFVYRHQDEMVVMNIVRAKSENGMMEYLTSQSGEVGEVITNPHYVQYAAPYNDKPPVSDSSAPEHLKPGNGADKSLHDRIEEIGLNYQLSLAETSRIAGRICQKLIITPRDEHRYGYNMWLDQGSGVLLKSEHLATDGDVLEQMIYSNIEFFGKKIPEDVRLILAENSIEMAPDMIGSSKQGVMSHSAHNWVVNYIPSGFEVASYQHSADPEQFVFEHIVFSDGLAAISVFIEKQDEDGPFNGVSQRGAMNAYLAEIEQYQLVVVGEVPLGTLELIGKSVRHASASIH